MLAKRIIPCLDVKDGKVVKGIHFKNLRQAGEVVDLAKYYSDQEADELVFLDISATSEGRKTLKNLVKNVASNISIPFTVGGGIKSIDDILILLENGADKVSINTQAVRNPNIVYEAAKKFGSQCIVVAIDAKRMGSHRWDVYIESGKIPTGINVKEWAKQVEDLGAGEILLTSIDTDGTLAGYDFQLLTNITKAVKIPVIASGGAGSLEHIYKAVTECRASAVLLASLLHFKTFTIKQIKKFLAERKIPVRMN
ncbi:MAG TPA: imidazole glycerol phosphate synthase subunit HisF [bacterium]|nr:imidazole glycerol phosphate synthase subunit HisF [bacterium]HOL34283.1 imidazole glycerol phosphate synthase subunit HisF [bacterium]HPP07661.1 imidazole glycerol phosphate synthase subunit HisF [bacterium]